MRPFSLLLTILLGAQTAFAQARGAAPAAPQPNPNAPLYQATGEQYRIYNFPGTGESIPYRLFVPSRWSPGCAPPSPI